MPSSSLDCDNGFSPPDDRRPFSHSGLADTLCELLSWVTPNGTYKTASCLKLLERLAEEGEVELPHKRACRPSAERAWVFGPATDPSPPLVARLADLEPVSLQPVTTRVEPDLWQEYVHRYHPLGSSNSASSQTSGVPL